MNLIQQNSDLVKLHKLKDNLLVFKFSEKKEFIRTDIDKTIEKCMVDNQMLEKLKIIYKSIQNNRLFSLEDIYNVICPISLDPEDSVKFGSVYECQKFHLTSYKEEILKIVSETKKIINAHYKSINLCTIVSKIFEGIQPFTFDYDSKNAFYCENVLSTLFTLEFGNEIPKAYKHYTQSNMKKKLDVSFCLKSINLLLDAFTKCLNSCMTLNFHCLDFFTDILYRCYFFYPNQGLFDFLIFDPRKFNSLKAFLLKVIDQNPLIALIDNDIQNGKKYVSLVTDNDCGRSVDVKYNCIEVKTSCLESTGLIRLKTYTDYQNQTAKDIHKIYYYLLNLYSKNLMGEMLQYDCYCYDVTNLLNEEDKQLFLGKLKQINESIKQYEKSTIITDTEINQLTKKLLSKKLLPEPLDNLENLVEPLFSFAETKHTPLHDALTVMPKKVIKYYKEKRSYT